MKHFNHRATVGATLSLLVLAPLAPAAAHASVHQEYPSGISAESALETQVKTALDGYAQAQENVIAPSRAKKAGIGSAAAEQIIDGAINKLKAHELLGSVLLTLGPAAPGGYAPNVSYKL